MTNFATRWEDLKSELKGQMDTATYNQNIADIRAANYENHILTLKTPNERVVQWLNNGLGESILDTVKFFFGDNDLRLAVTAEKWYEDESTNEGEPKETSVETPIDNTVELPPTPLTAHHFEPVINNWVKTPMIYYTHILAANYKPSTKIVIGAVIAHTLGIIDTRGNSPEWWENVTITGDLVDATKLSKNSVKAGIEEAIDEGWIKYRKSLHRPEIANDYALRYEGEAAYIQRLEVPN